MRNIIMLLILPVFSLFLFVGCGDDKSGSAGTSADRPANYTKEAALIEQVVCTTAQRNVLDTTGTHGDDPSDAGLDNADVGECLWLADANTDGSGTPSWDATDATFNAFKTATGSGYCRWPVINSTTTSHHICGLHPGESY